MKTSYSQNLKLTKKNETFARLFRTKKKTARFFSRAVKCGFMQKRAEIYFTKYAFISEIAVFPLSEAISIVNFDARIAGIWQIALCPIVAPL